MPKPSQPGAMTPGPEFDALITERWNRFESAHKIAAATRLSSGFIRKQLARLQAEGVELRPAGLPGMYVRPARPRPEAEVPTDRDALLKRAQSEQGWTPARSAWASMRFGAGVPASQVALELGGAITRSAVIGHLNRKGVSRSASALVATRSARKPAPKCAPVRIAPKTPAARAAMSPVPKPPRPLPVEVPSPANAKPLMQRGHGECAWIVYFRGADSLMCCAPVSERGQAHSWCADHARVGLVKPCGRGDRAPAPLYVKETARRFG